MKEMFDAFEIIEDIVEEAQQVEVARIIVERRAVDREAAERIWMERAIAAYAEAQAIPYEPELDIEA